MKILVSLAAASLLISAAAYAQDAKTNDTDAQSQAKSATTSQSTPTLRQDLKNDLQGAGFSNIHVSPGSYVVQAKDKSGDPVAMVINPNSMTEIVDEGSVPANNQQAGNNTGTASTFTTVPANDRLSSNIVGTSVYNNNQQDIGTIKDIAYGRSGVKAYIVGVGGFLGMGDHYVAVSPTALNLSYNNNAKSWHASLNATSDQLRDAPEYKYPSQS